MAAARTGKAMLTLTLLILGAVWLARGSTLGPTWLRARLLGGGWPGLGLGDEPDSGPPDGPSPRLRPGRPRP